MTLIPLSSPVRSVINLAAGVASVLTLLRNASTEVYLEMMGVPLVGVTIPVNALLTLAGDAYMTLDGEYLVYG